MRRKTRQDESKAIDAKEIRFLAHMAVPVEMYPGTSDNWWQHRIWCRAMSEAWIDDDGALGSVAVITPKGLAVLHANIDHLLESVR